MKLPLFLIMCLLVLTPVSGISIGVNRANVVFEGVLRDGYAQTSLVVVTDSSEPISGELLLYGDQQEWLSFSAKNFSFSATSPYTLDIIAQPPADARIDSYRVNMSVLTGELERSEGGLIGTSTRASLGVPITIGMTGTELRSCRVGGITVKDTERGQELEVEVNVLNTGNVRLNPEVEVIIYDKHQSNELSRATASFGREVLPTLTEKNALFYQQELQRDQYWATVKIPQCSYSGAFTFDVLEAGEVKDEGEFIQIDAPPWSVVGDIIPINALFRNRGFRGVRATFKGTITNIDTGQIVKVIETDEYTVAPDATASIETFFNPTAPGRYMVSGKVFYNNKLTPERNFVLNINGAPLEEENNTTRYLVYSIFVIIVVFLILIIRKKKRRHK